MFVLEDLRDVRREMKEWIPPYVEIMLRSGGGGSSLADLESLWHTCLCDMQYITFLFFTSYIDENEIILNF